MTERFPELKDGALLPLVESFYTIQGEGRNTGKAAYFIRLAGCDVRCPWCDAKNTWDYRKYPLTDIHDIADRISHTPARTVVITGGEPLRYNLAPLCDELHGRNYEILLETSGTQPVSGNFDWICVSPKRHMPPLPQMCGIASELKVVISCEDDFIWAEENRRLTSPECVLFLQPEWDNSSKILPAIIEYAKNHPEWRISLQTHKFMNIP